MTKSIAACAAALLLSFPAFAQNAEPHGPRAGDWEATLSGTGTSNNDFDNHTFGISGGAGKYLTDNVLVGARQSINFTDVENGDDVTNFSTRVFADWVFDLGKWRPFIGVNFGGIYGENVNDTFAAGPEVGVKYYADRNTFVYGLAEYQFTFKDADEADRAADDGQFYYTVGIGFNF
ncbi:MAG: outer membrane beta-barrel protein [Rhodospirillaceae bacterium]